MANYQHDPILNFNANLLKQAGTEQYTSGRNTTDTGVAATGDLLKSASEFQPIIDRFKQLLSGDTTALMQQESPEIDAVTQQFNAIRQMLSTQPRGGGKTSTLAQLPLAQTGQVANLITGARNAAPAGLQSALTAKAGVASDAISKLLTTGLQETGLGESGSEGSANIGLGGRGQDMSAAQTSTGQLIKQALISALI